MARMVDIVKLYHANPENKANDYENPNIHLIDFEQNHDFFQSVDASIHSIPTFIDNCRFHINKEYVLNNPQINWQELHLNNQNFTIEDIEEIMVKLNKKFIIQRLGNITITPNLYEKYADEIDYINIRNGNYCIIEMIRATKHKNWDWVGLSSELPINDILHNLDLPWIYSLIINDRKHLNIHQLNKLIDSEKRDLLDWKKITINKGITIENIRENPDYPWVYSEIFKNPNFRIKYLDYYLSMNNMYQQIKYEYKNLLNYWSYHHNKKDTLCLLWKYLSKSKSTTIADIDNHPEYAWDFLWVSSNPNITIEFFHKYRYKNWNIEALQQNTAISVVQFIEYNNLNPFTYSLNYDFLSLNSNIDLNYVINNPDKPWDYRKILFHNHMTYHFIFYNSLISKFILKATFILKLNHIIESYVESYV